MRGWGTFPTAALVAALAIPAAIASAADLHLTAPDRTPVRWQEWLADRGATAVLVWASWAPAADEDPSAIEAIAGAAGDRGLELVVVAVQESFDDASRALAGLRVAWLHDRHGAILKEYRLIQVPSLIVVDGEGALQGRLEPTSEALSRWRRVR
jgi:hypothetical protein